jgi:putative intracellular protease/amidase
MYEIITVLFNDFETLDAFGPIEVLGRLKDDFEPGFYSQNGGVISSVHKVPVVTKSFDQIESLNYILFIPGGIGTRVLLKNEGFIKDLKAFAEKAEYVLTVCTGSVLFSKTGILDGRNATTNKRVFELGKTVSPGVNWIKKARWVKDGNIYTSSGVSAGIDMALGFVSDIIGYEMAKGQSIEIEYNWNEDKDNDPFS